MKVCWFSTGVSSFMACYLSQGIDEIIYTHVANQHPDSLRFLHDCEKLLNRKITILQSDKFRNVDDVIRATGIFNTPYGAPCTRILKKEVRKQWESENGKNHTYIWGLDCNEKDRAERIVESMPEQLHEFPLIEHNLTKSNVHAMAERLGLKRPVMYDLGYNNNNCIGCVKGGMGYWNKIRVDFPEVFEQRAKLERELNGTMINGVFLDELDPNRGRNVKEILPDCGISCEILY
ncbi:MAG: hypothetical protein J6S85_26670 [Methanobrevibacter sp.]|nr:hypothetical protein [Methanobrevibacter sp.]